MNILCRVGLHRWKPHYIAVPGGYWAEGALVVSVWPPFAIPDGVKTKRSHRYVCERCQRCGRLK